MSPTAIHVDTQAALDGSRILAELALSPDEPSVLRVADEILPGITDAVRRQLKPAGTEDDDLLAVAYSVGVVIERNH
ncbi:hypothetical protein [Streptomyces justiciae]|uniref:hypothetical protein n=1 Tax=Streptomyces justiciae TaxID=2780140 RepID=UPI0021186989|nr:hypothetical protein [Streptomyces justiciae]MCW8383935.1 hypothetical protein [Streptomyces justiciae]